MNLHASVVVPTYRRPDVLGRCLAALAGQAFDGRRYEVIVADDAASEATRALVMELSERFAPGGELRYVAVHDSHGPAAARNAGWRTALSETIAFTDDDCVPEPGWLAAGLRALDAGADAATGRIVVPLGPAPPTDYERDAARLAEAEFVTANCFCRRSALAAAGGFDERFTMAWREDSDLHFSLLRRGFRVVAAPEAVVVHPVRPAPWGASIGQQRKSQFNALLYKKHPDLYRRRIQPLPPLHYYAAVGLLAGTAIGAAFRRRRLALAGAAVWGACTAGFCRRRLLDTSRQPAHVAEMALTSAVIPPLSIYWRLRGALKFRVLFL